MGSLGLRIKDFSDPRDFINKSKSINAIFKEVLLVSAGVVDLYLSITHEAELKPLTKILEKRDSRNVSEKELVLKSKIFEFNDRIR